MPRPIGYNRQYNRWGLIAIDRVLGSLHYSLSAMISGLKKEVLHVGVALGYLESLDAAFRSRSKVGKVFSERINAPVHPVLQRNPEKCD